MSKDFDLTAVDLSNARVPNGLGNIVGHEGGPVVHHQVEECGRGIQSAVEYVRADSMVNDLKTEIKGSEAFVANLHTDEKRCRN
jgi:hypothetical protein